MCSAAETFALKQEQTIKQGLSYKKGFSDTASRFYGSIQNSTTTRSLIFHWINKKKKLYEIIFKKSIQWLGRYAE